MSRFLRSLAAVLVGAALMGCGKPEQQGRSLERFGFAWDFFNHRISHLHVDASGDGPLGVAIVGGTSTTGVSAGLPPTCSASECQEFPFVDYSLVDMTVSTFSTGRAVVGEGSLTLLTGASGATGTIQVSLERRASGLVAPMIQGLTLDTSQALSSGEDACYNPAFGWHPRRIQVALGEGLLASDGRSVEIPVNVSFEAGNSLEDVRVCVDAVRDQAQVEITVKALVVVTRGDVGARAVDWSGSYAYSGSPTNPGDQPDPDPATRTDPWPVDEAIFGWQALDYRFHVNDPEDRGAYLRALRFEITPEGLVTGHANNLSLGTQLSGFDYTFSGSALAVEVGPDVTRATYTPRILAEQDDLNRPVVFDPATGLAQ